MRVILKDNYHHHRPDLETRKPLFSFREEAHREFEPPTYVPTFLRTYLPTYLPRSNLRLHF